MMQYKIAQVITFQLNEDYLVAAHYQPSSRTDKSEYEVDLYIKSNTGGISMFCCSDFIPGGHEVIKRNIALVMEKLIQNHHFTKYIDEYCFLEEAICEKIEQEDGE